MRLVLILLGLLLAKPVWAEWVRVGTGGEGAGASVIYVDPATVRKTPDGRRAWTMLSYDKPQPDRVGGGTFQSSKTLWEFDCAGERKRILQFTWHSGQMAAGQVVVAIDSLSNWTFVSPGSIDEVELQAVCSVPLK
jgi:hypothetical protein